MLRVGALRMKVIVSVLCLTIFLLMAVLGAYWTYPTWRFLDDDQAKLALVANKWVGTKSEPALVPPSAITNEWVRFYNDGICDYHAPGPAGDRDTFQDLQRIGRVYSSSSSPDQPLKARWEFISLDDEDRSLYEADAIIRISFEESETSRSGLFLRVFKGFFGRLILDGRWSTPEGRVFIDFGAVEVGG